MMSDDIDIETLWNDLLSRESERVQKAFANLENESQQTIIAHLTRMSVEPGWHPEQRISAQAALRALATQK